MCDTGGPRCELANELYNLRKRVKRTKKYKEASSGIREKIIYLEELTWKNNNKSLVQNHARKKEKWQVDSPKLSRRKMEALQREFPRETIKTQDEAEKLHQEMFQEYKTLEEKLSNDESYVLHHYTRHGYEYYNQRLRKPYRKDFPIPIETVDERILLIDEVFKKNESLEKSRTLYRHHMIPGGWTGREYAEKYFPVGGLVKDPAYLSTTEDLGYVAGHLFERRPTEYVIYQIISSKGISLVHNESENTGNIQSLEKERLLPRDSQFRVVGHRKQKLEFPQDRLNIRTRFARGTWNRKIPPQQVTVIMMIDEIEMNSW